MMGTKARAPHLSSEVVHGVQQDTGLAAGVRKMGTGAGKPVGVDKSFGCLLD